MWQNLWDLDWTSAQALSGLALAPVFGAIVRALHAKSNLEEKYREPRSMAQADLRNNHIYPRIAALITSIPSPPGLLRQTWQPGDEPAIEDHLQAVVYDRQVTEMSEYFASSADCLRLQKSLERTTWGQAWGLTIYFPGALVIVWALLQQHYSMPSAGYWAAACVCTSGVTTFLIFLGMEILVRNRLANLSMGGGRIKA